MRQNKLVCVAGMPGSGKTVVSDFFIKKGYQLVHFGDITFEILEKRGLPVNEQNERQIREEVRKKHGMEAYAKLNYPKFKKLLKQGNVIGDGLYSFEEYKFLKNKFDEQCIVIAVYAPPKIRYERLTRRQPQKKGDHYRRNISVKDARSRDLAEIEKLNKGGTIAMADFTIQNTKSMAYFKKQIKEIYGQIQKN